jgi:CelD/BcsL family acetyltransferase involved in cellulose biosynthesis
VGVTVGEEHSLDALASEWDDLADRAGAAPFVRPGWIGAWLRAFGQGEAIFVTARRDGLLTGLLPLERRGSTLAAPVNSETFTFEILGEDGEAILAHALTLGARRLRLDQIEHRRDLEAFRAATRGARTIERRSERSPFVTTSGAHEDYVKSVGSKFFADIRRRRRRLEEEGAVTIEVVDEPGDDLQRLLDEGYGLEGSGWKTAEGTSIAARPKVRAYYDDAARWAARRGILRLVFLRVDGKAVAFQLGVEDGGAYYFCKGGYDPAHHRFAPGKQLVAHMIERSFGNDVQTFEFLGESEPWKLEWTQEGRERLRLEAFGSTPLWAAEQWGRPLGRRAKRVLRRGGRT